MDDMKLEPCPFCGGTDLRLSSFSGWGNDVIICYDCLSIFSQQEITCEEDLIRAWNRRAESREGTNMSVSLWAWTEECDSRICIGDCDLCGYADEEDEDE